MESPRFIERLRHRVADEEHWLTRRRLAVCGTTLVTIGLLMGAFEISEPVPDTQAYSQVVALNLPQRLPVTAVTQHHNDASLASVAKPSLDEWQSVTVRSGQTLEVIFRRQGFSVPLMHEILALNQDTRGLTKIRPGETFEFTITVDCVCQ